MHKSLRFRLQVTYIFSDVAHTTIRFSAWSF